MPSPTRAPSAAIRSGAITALIHAQWTATLALAPNVKSWGSSCLATVESRHGRCDVAKPKKISLAASYVDVHLTVASICANGLATLELATLVLLRNRFLAFAIGASPW